MTKVAYLPPLLAAITVLLAAAATAAEAPISPKDAAIPLFNGKNLDGLYTWLVDTKYEDPKKLFTIENGQLHISGERFGYVATKNRYKDYHLVAEYRWGDKTWAPRKKNARDSGLILHCIEPDGSYQNIFMAGVEAQIMEGGVGDILLVNTKLPDGTLTQAKLSAETTKDRDGEMVWKQGAPRTAFDQFIRVNWYGRDPDLEDKLNFRGPSDLDSPGREWTRLDVISDGGHIKYYVNGTLANEVFDVSPSSGKILLQSEGAEIYVRRLELLPLNQKDPTAP